MSEKECLYECIKHANGWVVRTLRMENNSVLPSELITGDDDKRIGEKLLSAIVGTSVEIRKTDGGFICERK